MEGAGYRHRITCWVIVGLQCLSCCRACLLTLMLAISYSHFFACLPRLVLAILSCSLSLMLAGFITRRLCCLLFLMINVCYCMPTIMLAVHFARRVSCQLNPIIAVVHARRQHRLTVSHAFCLSCSQSLMFNGFCFAVYHARRLSCSPFLLLTVAQHARCSHHDRRVLSRHISYCRASSRRPSCSLLSWSLYLTLDVSRARRLSCSPWTPMIAVSHSRSFSCSHFTCSLSVMIAVPHVRRLS